MIVDAVCADELMLAINTNRTTTAFVLTAFLLTGIQRYILGTAHRLLLAGILLCLRP